jgi:hypothetical protein
MPRKEDAPARLDPSAEAAKQCISRHLYKPVQNFSQEKPDQRQGDRRLNEERQLWVAHCRAAQLLDDEPGPVARTILDVVNENWRRAYLGTG